MLKFSMYKIIWPVMALACGSLHTAVSNVRAKRSAIGTFRFVLHPDLFELITAMLHAVLFANRIGWRSQRLACGKRVPFALPPDESQSRGE
jgi:hypothetical protein